MTPDQTNTIKSWSEERDVLLREISLLRDEKNTLTKSNKDLSDSCTEISLSIAKMTGKLEAMDKFEGDRSVLISQDLATLSQKKAELELVVASITKEINEKTVRIQEVEVSFSNLVPLYERVRWQIGQLTETVDKVVHVNSSTIQEVNIMVDNLRKFLSDINIPFGK